MTDAAKPNALDLAQQGIIAAQFFLQSAQRHLGQWHVSLMSQANLSRGAPARVPVASISLQSPAKGDHWMGTPAQNQTSKGELGRATWLLIHTLAAEYPERPTRRRRREVKGFLQSLARVYPCEECSEHFQKLISKDPPNLASRHEFQMWACRVHNVVNQRIGKPVFNCDYIDSRWSALDCTLDGSSACRTSIGNGRWK